MSQTKVQLVAPVGIVTASGVNISGTVTATSYSGSGANLTGVGVTAGASVNTSGIITAVSFSGDGSNLSGVGFGTTSSAVTTGIITASKFSGSGIGLTNIGGPIAGLVYSPSIGATNANVASNISITFSKPIQAGVGTITLRTDSATGTIVESYDVASSNRLTISAAKLIIDPTSNLGAATTHYVVVPAGALKDTYVGISSNVGITSYYFTSQAFNYPLFVWGYNDAYGNLGQNDKVNYSSPRQIPGTQWSKSADGGTHTAATKTDGTLWVWGQASNGELGLNDTVGRSSPTQVPGTQWNSISADLYTTIATKTDGTLWVFGYNQFGTLGLNDLAYRSSPHQIPGTQWNKAELGAYDSYTVLATKTDGTLWVWGRNQHGHLGQNDRIDYSSPRQIPGTQWNNLGKGRLSSFSTKTDGTLWAWGWNAEGVLGLNDRASRSSPVQIPGTQWALINSNRHTLSTKTDGTLWTWGYNYHGQLGQNDKAYRSSPTQIPGTQWSTDAYSIEAGYVTFAARKTDGTLWVCGQNNLGSLGLNDVAYRSSPRQIPGTQWTSIHGDYYSLSAIKQEPQ